MQIFHGHFRASIFFVCDLLKSTITLRALDHICDRCADNKQTLSLVLPRYTNHEKMQNQKPDSVRDPDNRFGCYDQ